MEDHEHFNCYFGGMKEEPLDRIVRNPEGKGNQTIQMFIISSSLVILALLAWLFDSLYRLSDIVSAGSVLMVILAFGLSIAGIYIGFSEMKYSNNWVRLGLIGHLIIVALTVLYFIYIIITVVLSIARF